jgi:hypothetical protein
VEAELDEWLRPFYAARDGDDPQLAMNAAELVLDRVYGRPKQTNEIAELDEWLRPFYAARDGDDPQLAMKAAESVLDRVYGRPKQTNEICGPDQGAITLEAIARDALRHQHERWGC